MLVEDIVAITLYGKLVEPLWGNAEVYSSFYIYINYVVCCDKFPVAALLIVSLVLF